MSSCRGVVVELGGSTRMGEKPRGSSLPPSIGTSGFARRMSATSAGLASRNCTKVILVQGMSTAQWPNEMRVVPGSSQYQHRVGKPRSQNQTKDESHSETPSTAAIEEPSRRPKHPSKWKWQAAVYRPAKRTLACSSASRAFVQPRELRSHPSRAALSNNTLCKLNQSLDRRSTRPLNKMH